MEIKTAKEFLAEISDSNSWSIEEAMIEFAKYHVEKALGEAAYYAEIGEIDWDEFYRRPIYGIDTSTILTAYDLENIK